MEEEVTRSGDWNFKGSRPMVVGTTTLYHLDLDNEELETVQVYVNKDAASKEVRLKWVLWLKLWIVP